MIEKIFKRLKFDSIEIQSSMKNDSLLWNFIWKLTKKTLKVET